MNEKLKKRLKELRSFGLAVDVERSVCSFKMSSHIPVKYEKTEGKLSLDEDDEYLYAPFRALSQFALVAGFFDYTTPGILKRSTAMLKGQTVYPNHSADVNQWLGVVCKSWWDKSDGEVPPGINCTLKINKQWNAKIVDGIKTGAIHSVSVTIFQKYKKSHPDLGDDFWWHLGEKINGQIVRLIVTEIISYGEISLVWQGADCFAKRLFNTDSDINNDSGSNDSENNKTKGVSNMRLSLMMVTVLGLTADKYGLSAANPEVELDEAGQHMFRNDVSLAFQKLADENKHLKSLFSEFALEGESPENAIKRISHKAEAGEKFTEEVKKECVKFAKLSEGLSEEEELPAILSKSLDNCEIEELLKFKAEFQEKAEEKFPAVCSECGAKFTRASAQKFDKSEDKASDLNSEDYEI